MKATSKAAKAGPLADLDPTMRRLLKRESFPDWLPPMLATLTEDYFSSADWIYERKLDGVRVLALKDSRGVRLYSRSRILQNETYPELFDALAAQPASRFVVDGEVVAFAGKQTSFSLLQGRLGLSSSAAARATGIGVDYHLFDLLHLDGYSTRGLPQLERKRLLKDLFAYNDPLVYTEHRLEKGEEFLKDACSAGWEGLIAKRADGVYEPGRRSRDWLKFKCSQGQEFVIAGFTDPQGARTGFGALLLGYFDSAGRLHYAGKVGTGFDDRELDALSARLLRLERRTRPVVEDDVDERGVHWVRAQLVCEVAFTEWTREGRLRHPRYLGLRRDKTARDVVREEATHG